MKPVEKSDHRDFPLMSQNLLAQVPAEGFDCGDCTACCTVLAVTELQKPMRFACQHLCREGCRVYVDRPAGCRQFNCLWLRGALSHSGTGLSENMTSGNETGLRPDHLGVILDYFVESSTSMPCLIAFEVWTDAFLGSGAMEYLAEICERTPIRLSFRDGNWAEAASREEFVAILNSER